MFGRERNLPLLLSSLINLLVYSTMITFALHHSCFAWCSNNTEVLTLCFAFSAHPIYLPVHPKVVLTYFLKDGILSLEELLFVQRILWMLEYRPYNYEHV